MAVLFQINSKDYEADIASPIDISIPLRFNGRQPNAYGVETAVSKACESGDLIGDTRRGGSCNFEQYTLIPHCNGTHTECVGHITNKRISVRDCLRDVFVRAVLISIAPEEKNGDLLIAKQTLIDALNLFEMSENAAIHAETRPEGSVFFPNEAVSQALIIRTLPNDDSKLTRAYTDVIPPYFTTEAMEYIVELGIKHLLVDMPSIDRIYDEGKLSNHRIFWNVAPGSFEVNENSRVNNTITELIYVPNEVEDGKYLLNLQIAPFETDAAPSRPVIFRVH